MEHAFKDLVVDVMSSGVDRESQRRRRFHSGVTKLSPETEELLNDAKNVSEVSEKLLNTD